MKNRDSNINYNSKGVTLVELTLVIAVMITLISTVTLGVSAYRDWQHGLEGGEAIKAVYQAQRLYLADNPTTDPTDLVFTHIDPYFPNRLNAVDSGTAGIVRLPDVIDPDGAKGNFTVNFALPTPIMHSHTDKTGDNDGLWDVGK